MVDQKSSIFGACAAPGAPESNPNGGGLRPRPFGKVSGAPSAPRPQISTIVDRPKSHVLKTLVYDALVGNIPLGPEMVDFGGLQGPRLPRNPLEKPQLSCFRFCPKRTNYTRVFTAGPRRSRVVLGPSMAENWPKLRFTFFGFLGLLGFLLG